MKRQKLQETMIPPYETALREAEKSAATMEKYLHHVRQFVAHDAGRRIDKALVLEYKTRLGKLYIAGQGAMYDTHLFPKEPSSSEGTKSIIDMENMPVMITPNEYRDGIIRSMQ